MNHSWLVEIDNAMIWRAHSWAELDLKSSKKLLRVHYDQLFIISNNKILESFNMRSNLKGFFKENVLILIVGAPSKEVKKLKFRIKSNINEMVQILSSHFPVIKYDSGSIENVIRPKYRNLEKHLRKTLENTDIGISSDLPPGYENFVKACLLDPTFPKFVQETEKVIQKVLKNDA